MGTAGATAFKLLSGAALLCGLSAGCAVDQTKEVGIYRQILGTEQPSPDFAAGQPLTLELAMQLANHHNERLGLEGEQYLRALIEKDRAFAEFLPTINLAPSHFRQDPTPGADRSRLDVPVNAQGNLFRGMSDVASYRAAGRTVQQRRALLLEAQATVLLEVAATYYQILRSERLVEVLRSSLAVQETRVRDTRARREAGTVPPLDVFQTESQAASTRVRLIEAQNDAADGRTTLSFLIGTDVGHSPLVDDKQVPEALLSLEDYQQAAAEWRQDLVAARAAVDAARLEVDAAIGQYYPSVSLNLNVFLKRESLPSESDWNALLIANLPVFSAGRIHADVREAWSRLRSARLSELQTSREIRRDVEVVYQDLHASADRLRELQVQLTAAEQALRSAEELYKAGWGTNLDRLTAQASLLTAQLELASERYDRKLMYLRLLRATGQLGGRLPGEPATRPATTRASP